MKGRFTNMSNLKDFGGWEALDSLGKGGQGEVFRARRTPTESPLPMDRMMDAVRLSASYTYASERRTATDELVSFIRMIGTEIVTKDRAQIGALKLLHKTEDKAASEKAEARVKSEVSALKKFQHPALLRILDARPNEQWFVMEYFSRGTLHGHLCPERGTHTSRLRARSANPASPLGRRFSALLVR